MSSVPLSKRSKHRYVPLHEFRKLKKAIFEIIKEDFGYDEERFLKELKIKEERYSGNNARLQRYIERERSRAEGYYKQFIDNTTMSILHAVSEIEKELAFSHNAFTKTGVTCVPLYQIQVSLSAVNSWLLTIRQLLQIAAEQLPCNKNKYCIVDNEIQSVQNKITWIAGTLVLV